MTLTEESKDKMFNRYPCRLYIIVWFIVSINTMINYYNGIYNYEDIASQYIGLSAIGVIIFAFFTDASDFSKLKHEENE